ncbi:MAG TPA: hypothetical protein VGN75_07360, partial [Kaistia sp.]|nr:hypothetical protein [Kaistia sp.]
GGRIEGPLTWDGSLIRVTGVVPYPLYGDSFLPYPEKLQAQDGRNDVINDLNNRVRDIGPPPCEPGSCGCNGGSATHAGCD